MGRNTKWTNELQKEMMNFFKAEEKQNKTVNEIAEEFAKNHEGMTSSRVKSAYYKFNKENNGGANKRSDWSEKENGMLLHATQTKKGTLTSVFEEFAQKTNRTPQNVSQHYYFLMRSQKNGSNNETNNSNTKKVRKQDVKRENGKATATQKRFTRKNANTAQFDFNAMLKEIKQLPTEAIKGIQYIIKATKG